MRTPAGGPGPPGPSGRPPRGRNSQLATGRDWDPRRPAPGRRAKAVTPLSGSLLSPASQPRGLDDASPTRLLQRVAAEIPGVLLSAPASAVATLSLFSSPKPFVSP